jgi:prepilin-type N-terminal cleavage/methylation domain-containing protein
MSHRSSHRNQSWAFERFSRLTKGRGHKGFTLIELLIVIAIILILISIALPNFLEAQMRAKVTRAKAELRTLVTAQYEYYLDWNIYPPETEDNIFGRGRGSQGHLWLTSPIKYIASVPIDPFRDKSDEGELLTYESGGANAGTLPCYPCLVIWCIFTRGPDMAENEIYSEAPQWMKKDDGSIDSFSPTNGSRSLGDIFVFGGDSFWMGVRSTVALRSVYDPSKDVGQVVDNVVYLHRMPAQLP